MIFLIIGCSWGVPNYFGPPGDLPETHSESLLMQAGHTVFNCAKNGGSNLRSIERAQTFLQGKNITHPAFADQYQPTYDQRSIDWILWFQTEFIRDKARFRSGPNMINVIADHTYAQVKKLVATTRAQLALIGGNSDVHPCYRQNLTPNYFVPSWSSHILNLPVVTLDITDPELEFKYINNELELQKLKRASDQFPDRSHPGGRAHAELIQNFLSCVTKENSPKN
jgi:hypothetical protein